MNDIDIITKILKMKTIAVVGFSPKKERPSHYVSMYMKDNGYAVIPVNPGYKEIAGMTCYPNLESIPEKVDVVDIFRRSEFVLPIVDSAISMDAKAIWMQDHVFHEDAAQKAKDAGILVIMDNCMLRQHRLMN
ncbi:MAG: CoA-binding protein [Candidatus Neomarinimicrobiota bacterium]|nr:CoA-binding protein [Candidatus Neomarinimicrobiota bacterium]